MGSSANKVICKSIQGYTKSIKKRPRLIYKGFIVTNFVLRVCILPLIFIIGVYILNTLCTIFGQIYINTINTLNNYGTQPK